MKRIVLTVLLVVSALARAQWVSFAENDAAHYYLDPKTVSMKGRLRQVWELQDLKESYRGANSFRTLVEYDCQTRKSRTLAFSVHTKTMAAGSTLESSTQPWDWQDIAPESASELVLRLLCQGQSDL